MSLDIEISFRPECLKGLTPCASTSVSALTDFKTSSDIAAAIRYLIRIQHPLCEPVTLR